MVNKIHYRWDFVGLSTDTKPTPEESPKVVNGSTYYESDTSKLFVFYKDTWYERKPLGGGGGGSSYTAGDGIEISNNIISVDTDVVQPKLTAGTNITIDENNVISAEGGSSVNVVQTTGTSITDVMSQQAVSTVLFDDPAGRTRIKIGDRSSVSGSQAVAIGHWAHSGSPSTVAIGGASDGTTAASAQGTGGTAVGSGARIEGGTGGLVGNFGTAVGYNASIAGAVGGVAIGAYSKATEKGQFDISTLATTNTNGYNNSQYRLLTGLYDGQSAHDAVTVEQVNATIDAINTALSTSIPHIGA